MAWLDDRVRDHPKFVGLSANAFRTWAFCLCYCSEHGTRGNLDSAVVALRVSKAVARELTTHGIWESRDDGLWVHDWDTHNLKRDQARSEKRAFDRRRQQLFRDPELRAIVRERDADRCRYCAVEVNWNDRRGTTGATYDHVDPDGSNSIENLVVCCRSCNSQKAGRNPAQAGMCLLPTPRSDLSPDLSPGSKSEPSDTSRAPAGDRVNDHDHDQEEPTRAVPAPSNAANHHTTKNAGEQPSTFNLEDLTQLAAPREIT